jgi:Fic family protein
MISFEVNTLSPDLIQKIRNLKEDVDSFRQQPLDSSALERLREHFRTHHIYNSTGIEGNRLTLQETMLVLKEGIDISGKPLQDSLEVKNLAKAFDLLYELVQQEVPITENYLRQVHQVIVGDDMTMGPGEYRNIGVIITGSDHTPPEPFEVPIRMQELFEWISGSYDVDPIILSAIAHHELVKIHPFKDGNGRTARLLMNLILIKSGYPVCNILKTERPDYYESLSAADEGEYEPIIEIVAKRSRALLDEMIRMREETNRTKEWASRWGALDLNARLGREKNEFELWKNRMNLIKLEFKQQVDLLNQNLTTYKITFYEYPGITFEKYQKLKTDGFAGGSNFFSVRVHNKDSSVVLHTLMFKFYRNKLKYEGLNVIPLELYVFDQNSKDFVFIYRTPLNSLIKLRGFLVRDNGSYAVREQKDNFENEKEIISINQSVMEFFEQLLGNVVRMA